MLFVPNPTGLEAEALLGCHNLQFVHGQRVAVFECTGLHPQSPCVTSCDKTVWMQPFWDYSVEHRQNVVHSFGVASKGQPERAVARNSMLSALHIDDATQHAHLFMLWSLKNNVEWCVPGGNVDLADLNLIETVRREWDEELIGHGTLATAEHASSTTHVHPIRKPESAKLLVDTHVPRLCKLLKLPALSCLVLL